LDPRKGVSVPGELLGQFRSRRDHVHDPGAHGALRHTLELGVVGVLRKRNAAALFDALKAGGAPATGAAQHDAHGVAVLAVGERPKEEIDGRALPA